MCPCVQRSELLAKQMSEETSTVALELAETQIREQVQHSDQTVELMSTVLGDAQELASDDADTNTKARKNIILQGTSRGQDEGLVKELVKDVLNESYLLAADSVRAVSDARDTLQPESVAHRDHKVEPCSQGSYSSSNDS